jgi:hypothetical protein
MHLHQNPGQYPQRPECSACRDQVVLRIFRDYQPTKQHHLLLPNVHPVLLQRDGPRRDHGRRLRLDPVCHAHAVDRDTHACADAEELDLVPASQRENVLRPLCSVRRRIMGRTGLPQPEARVAQTLCVRTSPPVPGPLHSQSPEMPKVFPPSRATRSFQPRR